MSDLTIIKFGTGVLTRAEDGKLDSAILKRIAAAVTQIVKQGERCMLVSSGAVGAGVSVFGLTEYPQDIVTKQACAAIGQTRLMHAYEDLFGKSGYHVAQVLLTLSDFKNDRRRTNVTNTLNRLLEEPQIIPIINENDSVATAELCVGDNDRLAVNVAKLVNANRLILLTSVDGLLDPETSELIKTVDDLSSVLDFARGDSGRFSTGGMGSKLSSVQLALDAGIETIIGNGKEPERLVDIINGNGICTRFSVGSKK